jgi:hypothetical protein
MRTPRIFSLTVPVVAALLSAGPASGVILVNPLVTGEATPFNASYTGDNVFDSIAETAGGEYASQGQGAATFLEFNFGAPVTVDGFVNVTRANNVDAIGDSRLIFDTDGVPGFNAATDTVRDFNAANTGANGMGFINRFAGVTAQLARWEVTSLAGAGLNIGSMEMRFLGTAAGSSAIPGVIAFNGATPFGPAYDWSFGANGIAGRGLNPGVEYASASLGDAAFVDFDLGAIQPVTGFDWFDRMHQADRVTGFDMIFSNDPSFGSIVATRNYTGNSSFSLSDTFAPISARYVRYDVVSTSGAFNANTGLSDIVFYAVPEPATAALFSLAGLALTVRRRSRTRMG